MKQWVTLTNINRARGNDNASVTVRIEGGDVSVEVSDVLILRDDLKRILDGMEAHWMAVEIIEGQRPFEYPKAET
jgi:cation transport ATPase